MRERTAAIVSMPSTPPEQQGEVVVVLYVLKKDAKLVKNDLEGKGLLNKDFRMMPGVNKWDECIAVPIIQDDSDESYTSEHVVGYGHHCCPYSTSLLGNHQHRTPRTNGEATSASSRLTLVQRALLSTADSFRQQPCTEEALIETIESLNLALCPRTLEMLGDDNTLVVPRKAFDKTDDAFREYILASGCEETRFGDFFVELWKQLAACYKSPRVVRKGEVDRDSGVRESGYRLLWPFSGIPDKTGKCGGSCVSSQRLHVRYLHIHSHIVLHTST
jgi:hypothetical protein